MEHHLIATAAVCPDCQRDVPIVQLLDGSLGYGLHRRLRGSREFHCDRSHQPLHVADPVDLEAPAAPAPRRWGRGKPPADERFDADALHAERYGQPRG